MLGKALTLFIPISVAISSYAITSLKSFVSYSFDLLIINELLSILTAVLSIKQQKEIKEIDLYSFFVDKIKNVLLERLNYNEKGKNEKNKN